MPAPGLGRCLAARLEEQVSLLVNPLAGDGRVKALYERWGYEVISAQQPPADGPDPHRHAACHP